jgi:hypothetical protein
VKIYTKYQRKMVRAVFRRPTASHPGHQVFTAGKPSSSVFKARLTGTANRAHNGPEGPRPGRIFNRFLTPNKQQSDTAAVYSEPPCPKRLQAAFKDVTCQAELYADRLTRTSKGNEPV